MPENRRVKRDFIEISGAGATLQAERFEQIISVADIEHSQRFQDYCKSCPHYGKNLACPPSTPYFADYAGKSSSARVICYRISLTGAEPGVESQKTAHREAGQLLARELAQYLKQGHKVAGAGFCRSCPTCAAENGETVCRKPAERIFSLEAMGVNVDALLKKSFGFGLEWTRGNEKASYLCVPGAVIYDEKLV